MYKRQLLDSGTTTQAIADHFPRDRQLTVITNSIAIAATPVSYTHLRAHETVLDLVCRLLLEKKKNQVDTTTSSDAKYKTII